MKYLVATFKIEVEADLMQVCRDLLADSSAEAGFESFEETEQGLEAYVQKDFFDKEALDNSIADFPIESARITYEVKEAEDKDWNQEWEEQGFEPICIDDQILIYDAKHPDLHPTTSPDHIEIGIEAKLAFGTGNHETTRMIVSTLLGMNLAKKRVLDCGCGTGILGIACAKRLVKGALDIVVRHIGRFRLGDNGSKLGIAARVSAAAFLDRDDHFTGNLGESLCTLRVSRAFRLLYVVPFGMSGHKNSLLLCMLKKTTRFTTDILPQIGHYDKG